MAYETKEVVAIRQYMVDSGMPHRVTSTIGGKHAPDSRHYRGLAVDLAGPIPSRNSDALLGVFKVLELVKDRTHELFYGGPGGALYRDGRPFISASLSKTHEDHVHVSVDPGVILQFPFPKEPAMPDDPNRPNIKGPVKFQFFTDPATGVCTGYFIYNEFGELHSYGPAAVFFGVSEVVQ